MVAPSGPWSIARRLSPHTTDAEQRALVRLSYGIGSMAEFPAQILVVTVPRFVYKRLEALASKGGDSVEDVTAELLVEVVRLGTSGDRYAVVRLATQVADLLADRWQQRQAELA